MNTMFSTLLQLPLFQGISQEDFTHILGKVKLHFSKHKAGEVIIEENSPCTGLVFLLQGEVAGITTSNDGCFSIIEKFQMPHLIEPQALFGMDTFYKATYTAHTDANTVSIDKSFIMKDLFKYEIFRINYMNYVCNRTQCYQKKLWMNAPDSVEVKIKQFILSHIERPEGEKILRVKMEDLAHYVDDTRLNVSKALNNLQEKGVLQLNRKEVVVPDGLMLLE